MQVADGLRKTKLNSYFNR